MEPIITLRGVSKRYPGSTRPALDAIDLDIEAGRITAIMGPSGCGKSTLLNLIGALDRPTSGEIVDGRRPRRPPERDRGRAVPPREGRLRLPVLPPARGPDRPRERRRAGDPRGPARAPRRTRAPTRCSPSSASRTTRRKFPATLSGGERQRLAIARAVINDPAVLLADEPTGALDRRNGEAALAILEDLNRRGQTILLVTHDEHLATQTAHRTSGSSTASIVDDGRSRMVA